MVEFEAVFKRIFNIGWHKYVLSLIVGTILSSLPILNLIAYGYIYRYVLQVRTRGDFSWADWQDWKKLFFLGIPLFLIQLLYIGLPVLVFVFLFRGRLGLMVALFVMPPFVASALVQHQESGYWQSIFNINLIIGRVLSHWRRFILPSFVLSGVLKFGFDYYGLTLFATWMVCLPYYTLLFIENKRGH